MDGWIILDKPLGLTSAQGVAAIKRLWRQAGFPRPKIGHGGTLDPLATGVLPIALGEATKLTGRMLNGDKAYDFTVRFGVATETEDAEGAVVATSDVRPSRSEIEAVLPRFTGPIEQRPPAYSALKVDGERAYARARAGETVVLALRGVTIHALDLLEANGETATFSVACSKGTYVRSLARDIAKALGTVGHVVMLRRTKAGPFGLESAITLDKLGELAMEQRLIAALLPLTAGLDDIPALAVNPGEAARLKSGQTLAGRPEPDGLVVAMLDAVPVALARVEAGTVRVERGFNL
ncbi:tRNA pseudouridine(55) synthase TruB [Sphingosinicella microcystinivorans]|uniref:tRNA pseudouridine synthase B n=1 Tax=Sphingosinicella microcystinivorans TaxID=335406 RepID=A0AAD1D4M7_SPHMI|nr:tRNA pseudouridine(55) synthase TruB [Sphingosinicella microcystinivorans]RKS90841.1 tRNA pseudouridine synthase B [Sphingosinicella microcystinivorans]BBE33757.1 tRNA pseudouridine synthase B [Sphingosinicella microcystinivorans]